MNTRNTRGSSSAKGFEDNDLFSEPFCTNFTQMYVIDVFLTCVDPLGLLTQWVYFLIFDIFLILFLLFFNLFACLGEFM